MPHRERRSNIAMELFHDGTTAIKLLLLSTLIVTVAFLCLMPLTASRYAYVKPAAYILLAILYLAANAIDAWILIIAYWRWKAHSLHREVAAAAVLACLQAAYWHTIFRSGQPKLILLVATGAIAVCLPTLVIMIVVARHRRLRAAADETAAS